MGVVSNMYRTMNLTGRLLIFTMSCVLVLTAGLRADSTEPEGNPYRVILDRNPFGLRSAPPPIPAPKATNVIKDVKFTGITSDGNSKEAWFVIPPGPGQPQPESLSLSEGDAAAGIKVLKINEEDAAVTILNGGAPVTLNFREHGIATPIIPTTRYYGVRGAAGFAPRTRL
jgi:hypothetical protein